MTNTPVINESQQTKIAWLTLGSKYETACPQHLWDPQPDTDLLRTINWREALETPRAGDTHFVTYLIRQPDGRVNKRPPRLRKEHLPLVTARGFEVLHLIRAADVDAPAHANITREQVRLAAIALRDFPGIWYVTRGGIRILQVMTHALTALEYEVSIARWLPELQAMLGHTGLHADNACKDWTRFMRCPRVVRSGRNQWDTLIQTRGLRPIDPGDCTPPAPPPKLWRPAPVRLGTDHPEASRRLDRACTELERTPSGARNPTLASKAFAVGMLVSGGHLDERVALQRLHNAIAGWDADAIERLHSKTLQRCFVNGMRTPASLSERLDLDALRARWKKPIVLPDPERDGFDVDVTESVEV